MSSEDDLLSALGSLPMADVPDELGERIQKRAHVVLAAERRLAARPGLRRASRIYSRAIEPVLVVSACVVYLGWAASVTLALLR